MKSHITFIHANDIHGQFMYRLQKDYSIHGGISLLSGYLKEMRKDRDNVCFTLAGDLTEKSLMDTIVKGISTVDIYNYISPDVACIGNHELDFGLTQLLFFENCINFPLINANLYTRFMSRTILPSHYIKKIGDVKVLFIGIMDKSMYDKMPMSDYEKESVLFRDSLEQIKLICAEHKTPDIDMVVLLSHMGYENDLELAANIPAECGVSLILGGHSHIHVEEAVTINDIVIVQSDYGTNFVGKLEVDYDHDLRRVDNITWELVSIDDETVENDYAYDAVSDAMIESKTGRKKNAVCEFDRILDHNNVSVVTPLGQNLCDLLYEIYAVDFVWFPSKTIRRKSLGPIVTYMDLLTMLPYDGKVVSVRMTGKQLLDLLYRNIPKTAEEFMKKVPLQFSDTCQYLYDGETDKVSFLYRNQEIDVDKEYTIAMPEYLYQRFPVYFEVEADDAVYHKRILSASILTDLVAYLSSQSDIIPAHEVTASVCYLNTHFEEWKKS